MVAEQTTKSTDLTARSGGALAWLQRLVAGRELDALHARIEQLTGELAAARARAEGLEERAADGEAAREEAATVRRESSERITALERARDEARAKADALEKRLDAATLDDGPAVAALRLEIEQRAREQADLEQTIAKKEAEKRELAQKAAKAQQAADAAEKKVRDLEAKAKDGARGADGSTAKTKLADVEKKLVAVEANARELATKLAARDAEIGALEAKLAAALARPEESALERALQEREALVEELHLALARQRNAT